MKRYLANIRDFSASQHLAFKMYLMYLWCISNVCSSPCLYHKYLYYTRYRYGTKNYHRYQSIRPLMTMSLRGLLLGVGDGGREG